MQNLQVTLGGGLVPLWAWGCVSLMSFVIASYPREVAVLSPGTGHQNLKSACRTLKLDLGYYMSAIVCQAVEGAQIQRGQDHGGDAAASAGSCGV